MLFSLEIWLIAVALAMDCFSVSITCGIIERRMGWQVWLMALLFGLFQGIMPLIGWLAATVLVGNIEAYDHWVAFGLLAFLGGKMIWEARHEKEGMKQFNPSSIGVLLTLSVATSIDALAVGFTFRPGLRILTLGEALVPCLIIGFASLLLSLAGKFIGVRVGRLIKLPAEQIGGVILIIIGIKILYEHLLA